MWPQQPAPNTLDLGGCLRGHWPRRGRREASVGHAADGHGDLRSHKQRQNIPSCWSRHQHLVATAQEAAEKQRHAAANRHHAVPQQPPASTAAGAGHKPLTAPSVPGQNSSPETCSHSHPLSQASIGAQVSRDEDARSRVTSHIAAVSIKAFSCSIGNAKPPPLARSPACEVPAVFTAQVPHVKNPSASTHQC